MPAARAQPLRTSALPVGVRLIAPRAAELAGAFVGDRPAIAWSLALLFLFKGILCLSLAGFPISAREPVELVWAAGALGVVAALGVWLFAKRINLLGFEVLAAIGSILTSAMIARANTPGGVMIGALAYTWVSIYAAHFFPRRATAIQALLISAGSGAAMLANGISHVEVYWSVVTATNWSICVLLGNLSESLRRHASTDHLTGLLNRSGFLAAAVRARTQADRSGRPLTVAVIDLDDFKQVNDCGGHAAGDSLLTLVGNELRSRMRKSDVLARHGGDEFVLLLDDTGQSDAERVLACLRERGDPIDWCSGCSEWFPGEPLDEPLARADMHLYAAKSAKQLAGAATLLAG